MADPVTDAHTLRIEWVERGEVPATRTLTVERDEDGDGVPDSQDVCPGYDDTVDSDGDSVPDGCDDGEPVDDRDGDGHHNDKERAHGSDPRDPDSTPTRGNGGNT